MARTKYTRPQPAAEFVKQLSTDADYQATVRDNERRNRELQRVAIEEDGHVVSDLRLAGLRVGSVWELVGTKRSYTAQIPILLDHVVRPYSPRTLDGLVRALIVPEARGQAWCVLRDVVHARKSELSEVAPYALGTILYALGVLARPADIPDMLRLLADEELGSYRIGMLASAPTMTCSADVMEQARAFVPDKAVAREYKKFLKRLSY